MSIPYVITRHPDEEQHRTKLAEAINGLVAGKLDAIGSFTLAASTTTTTVSDNKFESNMVPVWAPTSANAAAEVGAGGMYLSARAKGSFTLTHANNAQTDRTFVYVRIG